MIRFIHLLLPAPEGLSAQLLTAMLGWHARADRTALRELCGCSLSNKEGGSWCLDVFKKWQSINKNPARPPPKARSILIDQARLPNSD